MASSVTHVFAGLSLALFTTLTAVAAEGTVSFTGAIQHDLCLAAPANHQLTFSCFDRGRVQTQQVSLQQVTRGDMTLPGVAQVSLNYINPQKTEAVVQIDYR